MCLYKEAFVWECFKVGWVLYAYYLWVLFFFRVSPGGCTALLICLVNTFLLLSHHSYLTRPRACLSLGEVTHGSNKHFSHTAENYKSGWSLMNTLACGEFLQHQNGEKKSVIVYWDLFLRNKISHSLSLQWATVFIEEERMGLCTNLSCFSLRL